MTQFKKEDLLTLERLARLRLTEHERAHLLGNLQDILQYIDILNEVDTKDVPPCSHVIPKTKAPLREDTPHREMDRDAFLKNAPDSIGGLLKVPPVIKDEL